MSKRSDSDSSLPPTVRTLGRHGRSVNAGKRGTEVQPVTPNWAAALREQHAKKVAEEAGADNHTQPEEK